jgi:rRNA-processing protein FCF1
MKTVVFDTSFLVNSIKAKVDFIRDIRMEIGAFNVILPSPVIDELEYLAGKNRDAKTALEILKVNGFEKFESGLPADLAVQEAGEKTGGYVASTDWAVRRRAKASGLKLVTLRQGKRVEL